MKAVILHQAGKLDEAEAAYQTLLKNNPNDSDALHYLGLIAFQKSRYADAVNLIASAIKINRRVPAFHCNLGNAYKALGQFDSAIAAFLEAVRLDPQFQVAYSNLGNILQDQGRLDEAIINYGKALALRPEFAEAHYGLGNAFQKQGKLDVAASHYRQAISLKPDYADAHYNFGIALSDLDKPDEAAASYRHALRLKPDFYAAYNNLAHSLSQQGKLDEALACLQQAHSLAPTHLEWDLQMLVALPSLADSRSHISMLRERLLSNARNLLAQEGSVHSLENASFNLFGLAYHGADDKPLMEQVTGLIRAKAPALNKSLVRQPAPEPHDTRIRVGFISSLFYSHTMGKLTQGYIRHLDRSRFHVTVIHALGSKNDLVRNAIDNTADAVVFLPSLLEAAQQAVADLALDILHYPDIGMMPFTNFLAYSRLAPVQTVSWGHPVTTGLDTIDYFLSVDAAEPEGAEKHYTETLVRLSRMPVHYVPLVTPAQIASRSTLGLPESGNLYGCLQTLFKFHPDFDAVLADIVARDPQAWIIVIGSKRSHLRHQLHERWSTLYPALSQRVVFLLPQPMDIFIMLAANMDVLLDTPHFGCGSSIYDSMPYGIPIITWPGGFMRGRLVAGVYKWLGITDAPIAATLDDYAPLAVSFATDHGRRETLKQQLIEKSPALYQDELALNELEAFFEQALAAAQRGEKLSHWSSGLPWPAQQIPSSQPLPS